jgi:hypothetical protein
VTDIPEPAAMGARLAAYRIDVSGRVWPFLVPATVFVSLGAVGVCSAFISHGRVAEHAEVLTLLGSACVLAGLALSVQGARPFFSQDEYLVVTDKGLFLKLDKRETFLVWEEITAVAWDAPAAALVIQRGAGPELRVTKPFVQEPGERVAAHVDDLRRKAAFRLL